MRQPAGPATRLRLAVVAVCAVLALSKAGGRQHGSRRSLYSTVPSGGVHIFHLPGYVDLGYQGREAVLFHVFLKLIQEGDVVRLRGFAFAESSEHDWYNWLGVVASQPPLLREWLPHIYLRSLRDGSVIPFDVLKQLILYSCVGICIHRDENADSRFVLPLPLQLSLPAQLLAWHSDFELRVDGWKNFVYLSTSSVHRPVPVSRVRPMLKAGVHVILPPFLYPTSPEFASQVLYHHVTYHAKLGYAGTTQYATSIYLEYFVQDAKLVRLIKDGQLRLVLWDAMTECADHPKCFQSVIHSYSLLSISETADVLLHMLDHDEFVAMSRPGLRIQGVVARCFNASGHVMFERIDTHCSSCDAAGGTPEDELWALGMERTSPLVQYDMRSAEAHRADLGKSVARPGEVLVFGVHAGVTLDGREPERVTDASCGAYIAHLPNLFERRESMQRITQERHISFVRDRRWHWVLSAHEL